MADSVEDGRSCALLLVYLLPPYLLRQLMGHIVSKYCHASQIALMRWMNQFSSIFSTWHQKFFFSLHRRKKSRKGGGGGAGVV
jgi:hypothetical protein